MGLLRISGTTSRLDCSRQLRRCGTTRPHCWHRETWWWNEHVEKAIAAKRTAFKAWKAGKGTRASYDAAKRNARHAVYHARQEADKKVYENIDSKSKKELRQPLTYRLMESVGLGGPKWHGSSWQRGIAESGSSRLSTLMIDVPGDLVWDLPCVQQAKGADWCGCCPLYLLVNQKSDYDDMIFLSQIKSVDIYVGYSLEMSQWCTSNEYLQYMFSCRNKKCIYLILPVI